MSTALQIKVVSLLGYVALSTTLALMLTDESMQGAAQTLFAYSGFH